MRVRFTQFTPAPFPQPQSFDHGMAQSSAATGPGRELSSEFSVSSSRRTSTEPRATCQAGVMPMACMQRPSFDGYQEQHFDAQSSSGWPAAKEPWNSKLTVFIVCWRASRHALFRIGRVSLCRHPTFSQWASWAWDHVPARCRCLWPLSHDLAATRHLFFASMDSAVRRWFKCPCRCLKNHRVKACHRRRMWV